MAVVGGRRGSNPWSRRDSTARPSTSRGRGLALSRGARVGPSHAYLFRGPRGAGKRAAARAFAAEILATGAEDPDDARRRALLDPSPHPDLVWLAPSGAQHLVEAVRERVIRAASYRPFEGGKRVFVLESAEAMRDESQNALLKTLEEPPGFAHLILLSSEPEALLETIASRCQPVEFAPLPSEAVEAALRAADAATRSPPPPASPPATSSGPASSSPAGPEARAAAVLRRSATLRRSGRALAQAARRRPRRSGAEAEAAAREALEEEKEAGVKRSAKEIERRGETGRPAAAHRDARPRPRALRRLVPRPRRDRRPAPRRSSSTATASPQLRAAAEGLDPAAARRAAELVQDTRRRLDLNVSEELALEALYFRLEREIEEGEG